ncbi:MAG: glycosyltransferase [Candidatus Omnitrophota bacterium]
MPKRVLLLYITVSSGHHKAVCAIENALKLLRPDVVTMSVNSFNYTNPILEKIINRTYMGIIKRTPEVWEYLYDNPKVVKNTQMLKDAIHRFNNKKLTALLDDFKPDVVVATQAFPCGMVADLKKTFNLGVSLVGVLTDFYPHSYWMYESVDRYTVASEEAKDRFIQDGIPQEKISIVGIPIDIKFAKKADIQDLKAKFGLNSNGPVVLVMGGGGGLGPIKVVISSLERLKPQVQVMVVAGTNIKLHKWLIKRARRYKKKLIPLGYTDNIDELMQVSDILITKPGGITVSEALAKSLPIIIVNPIPGQEAKNTKFLIKHGAAVKAENEAELLALLENLFSMPYKLKAMSAAASKIGKPESSMDIARMILNL